MCAHGTFIRMHLAHTHTRIVYTRSDAPSLSCQYSESLQSAPQQITWILTSELKSQKAYWSRRYVDLRNQGLIRCYFPKGYFPYQFSWQWLPTCLDWWNLIVPWLPLISASQGWKATSKHGLDARRIWVSSTVRMISNIGLQKRTFNCMYNLKNPRF